MVNPLLVDTFARSTPKVYACRFLVFLVAAFVDVDDLGTHSVLSGGLKLHALYADCSYSLGTWGSF